MAESGFRKPPSGRAMGWGFSPQDRIPFGSHASPSLVWPVSPLLAEVFFLWEGGRDWEECQTEPDGSGFLGLVHIFPHPQQPCPNPTYKHGVLIPSWAQTLRPLPPLPKD